MLDRTRRGREMRLVSTALLVLLIASAAPLERAAGQETSPPSSSGQVSKESPGSSTAGGARVALIDWFRRGGIFMWPLFACSIFGFGLALERWYTLSRARINTRRFVDRLLGALRDRGVDGAIEICTRTRGPIAAILHSGLMRADKGPDAVAKAIESAGVIEMAFLQRSLTWLASITVIAPLLGFLGTVSGMIHAFDAIAAADHVSARVVASGISEALIATEAGLCIAIPIQTAYNWFITQIDKFITEMEEASVEVVDTLVDLEHQRGGERVRA